MQHVDNIVFFIGFRVEL